MPPILKLNIEPEIATQKEMETGARASYQDVLQHLTRCGFLLVVVVHADLRRAKSHIDPEKRKEKGKICFFFKRLLSSELKQD
jgi:hypothetical protein